MRQRKNGMSASAFFYEYFDSAELRSTNFELVHAAEYTCARCGEQFNRHLPDCAEPFLDDLRRELINTNPKKVRA